MGEERAGQARIGVLTVSDRASRGEYEDRGAPAVVDYLRERLGGLERPVTRIVPDWRGEIETALRVLCDEEDCGLVVTTGGTGPAPRDVTPEATAAVCEKLLPGFGERMRAVSVETVPTAILSRQLAGVRGSTLVLNLPGSPRAIAECLDAVFPALVHAVRLLGGGRLGPDPAAHEPP